jgi:hypothetical protein
MTGMPGPTVGGDGSGVLEDPTGTRARWMRRAGRLVFVLFLGWLLAIVLGGLGLMPVAGIPLTHVLRPSQGPPPLTRLPTPRTPSASDLRPAVPAKVFTARVAKKTAHRASHVSHGKSSVAPGQTKTSHGKSATAPGRTKTTAVLPARHRPSTVAPGQAKKTTVAPAPRGKSTIAPGLTKTTATTTTARNSKKP